MKIIKKYTDETYASIKEIQNDFPIGSSIIINQIENYRNHYKLYFYYDQIKYSIVYLPKLQKKLNEYFDFNSKDILHPFIQIFVLRNKIDLCKTVIIQHSLPIEILDSFNYIYSYEEDITKSFIEWFEHIATSSYMKMLLYKCKGLSEKQIDYFINHNYFNICDYQIEMNLSYECARLHLNGLYRLNIIKRHKIGKRYMYKIND